MENTVIVLLLLCALSSAEKALSQNNPHPDQSDRCAQLGDIRVQLAEDRLLIQQLQKDKGELEAKLKEQESQLEQTKEKLEEQDANVKDLKTQLQEQAAKLKAQTSEVDTLKQQQQEQSAKLRELQASEVNPMKEQLRGQVAELNSVKAWTNVTETHLNALMRDKAVGQVAFSVSLLASGAGNTGPFNTHTPLVFRYVISNIGNAYSPNTGHFTAPVKGAYHFELHIYGLHVGAWLVKNGVHICMAYGHQTSGQGKSSNGATLLLEPGDAVYARQCANTRILDNANHHSTFSGHLLFPM